AWPSGRASGMGRRAPPGSRVAPPAAETCRSAFAKALAASPGGETPTISAGDRRLEHLSGRLANARSKRDLFSALDLIAGELHADKITLSRWHSAIGPVESLADSVEQTEDWRYTPDAYPATTGLRSGHGSARRLAG